MSLKIIRQGLLDTIQDSGRTGYQHLGINPGGVMDQYAAQVANYLVGNKKDEAVIEMHFPAAVYLFNRPALIALTGADLNASLNGEFIPVNHPILVDKNSILQFHRIVNGSRAYLAVRGGFTLEKWMGSYSTNIKAKTGGWFGRPLAKDDEIGLNEKKEFSNLLENEEFRVLPWSSGTTHHDSEEVFILPGREWDWLDAGSKDNFLEMEFTITHHSDRMAYHLDNISLTVEPTEIVSSAVNFGTIQFLPGLKIILLMADHQTTGGYPRIAHVIRAHHSRLSQKKPGDRLRFVMTGLETAETLLLKQEQELMQLQNGCLFRLAEILN